MFIAGVIGYPLKKTFSPLLHNSALNSLNLKGYYFPLCVPEKDFEMMIVTFKKLKFAGLNITHPYKIKMIRYLDGISSVAEKIGAVNTVIIKNQKLFGENTDRHGFYESLKEYKIDLSGKKILIIGAGGVARAIAYVIYKKKPKTLFFANRTRIRSFFLARRYNGIQINFEDVPDIVGNIDMVINATAVDLHNKIIAYMKSGSVYYDTNYCFSLPSPKNMLVVSGITMLVYQAAYSFSIWTGRMPPINIMKNAIKEVQID